MPDLESHGDAWHRCYEIRGMSGWAHEEECPIRLRGYSELIMGRIKAKLRKRIDSALKSGYRLDSKKDHVMLLDMICEFNPIQRIAIGYIGKSKFHVYVPEVDAQELQETLSGLSVMTETFKGSDIGVSPVPHIAGYTKVYLEQIHYAGGKGSSDQPQLKASFTHARQVIGGYMEKDAAVRECIAAWVADDSNVIRIPFDTHQEE